MKWSSPARRSALMVALAATTTACGHSPTPRPVIAADPIVETRTVRQIICPAEVTATIPAEEIMPANAVIEASREVLRWIGRRFAREELLAKRLDDAREQCNG